MASSPAPTSSSSPPSLVDMVPPSSSNPLPPTSQTAPPSKEPPVTAPPQFAPTPPLPSSSPPISPPLIENPASPPAFPPLLFSPPPSPPTFPAPPVMPLPPISTPAAPSPETSIPVDSPPPQPPPSPAVQILPPPSPLTVISPPPPAEPSSSMPSEESPGGSPPLPPKQSVPPSSRRKPTPPETPVKPPSPPLESPPLPRSHQTPAKSPPSSPDKKHPPTKSPPRPDSGASSDSPPPPSARPSSAAPPSGSSISPIASDLKPIIPLNPTLVTFPPPQSGTSLGPVVPAATAPTNAAGQTILVRRRSWIKPGEAAGISVPIAFVILLVVSVVWFMRRKKTKGTNNAGYTMPSLVTSSYMPESNFSRRQTVPLIKASSGSNACLYSPLEGGLANSKSWFTLEELSDITNGFSPRNILGEGGFGTVYKGCLPDGREVAVKQLKVGSGQGEREFRAEVEIISRIHHKHLVTLVGHCISENQRLLVYDFVQNNTLFYHLHGRGRAVLDWSMRVKVAAGAARGIAYLHEDCHPRIIHRDIKSSNILLDNNFEARVSDFGLAKITMDAETHVTTRVMGTFGYLAPEYASSGKLTDRSDVFSFGVVLLELITGRKPVDASQPVGDESLVEWARPLMSQVLETGDLGELPDPRLERNYNETEMFQMIEAAAACVRHSVSMRPRMGLIMRALDNLAEKVDLHNGVIPGKSELLDSIANSEEIRLFQRMAFGSQNYNSKASGFSQSQTDV